MENHRVLEKRGAMAAAALVCCLLWGSSFPSIKLSYIELGVLDTFQQILLAGLRFCLAGVMVLAFVKLFMRTKLTPPRREIPLTLLVALLQTFGSYVAFYIGMAHTTGIKGSILASSNVFMVAVMAHFVFRSDKLSLKKGLGLFLGFAGVVIANVSLLAGEPFSFALMGEGFVLLHCLLCAVVTILIRKFARQMDTARLNGWQLLLGGMMLTVTAIAGGAKPLIFNTSAVLLLVYMAAISAVAFTLWFMLLKYHKATVVEQYRFAIPLFGSLISVLVVPGEYLGFEMAAAAALVAIGILIVNREGNTRLS